MTRKTRNIHWKMVAALLFGVVAATGCKDDVSDISSQVRPPKSPYKQGGEAPKAPVGGVKDTGGATK
jgi:hypothetical protein